MLKQLSIRHVGPLTDVEFALDPRLNVITGDNGLGKSLLLDIAFWAECGLWPRSRAEPAESYRNKAELGWVVVGEENADTSRAASYDPVQERWRRKTIEGEKRTRRPVIVYAMVDGGFAVFDQARAKGVMHEDDEDFRVRRASRYDGYYVFSAADVYDGVESGQGHVSNGLIRDWSDWQYRHKSKFRALGRAMTTLSEGIGEPIKIAKPRRVSSVDSREIPWLKLPYGEIPITQASAAVRRVAAMAYMLVWAWTEHVEACRLTGTPRTSEMLFLFDEVESHLHPKWQRVILPALLASIGALTGKIGTQIIAATHSPLVLASLEPLFDEARDQLLLVDLNQDRRVEVRREQFARKGRADVWLTSQMFGLGAPTSVPAEHALSEAKRMLSGGNGASVASVRKARAKLGAVVSDSDPMLARLDAMEVALTAASRRRASARKKPTVRPRSRA